MPVSSNTLIHLTRKSTALFGILREGFRIKYCNERIETKLGPIIAGFPMVSLSDLPLSELYYHLESYGNYGIGLKKEWAKRKGLNPVLYFDSSSNLGEILGIDFQQIFAKVQSGKLDPKLYETVNAILSYMKTYEGVLKTKNITRKDYRFSDEREWRYIPLNNELNGAPAYIDPKNKDIENKKISYLRLDFELDDINYIFVNKEDEISKVINTIRASHSKKPHNAVERLMTRIITTKQVRSDF